MNSNQAMDSDLQKAIDDITKTTSVDPVFSDPIAAPSSVPEGDTGEMGEAIGPFPAPEPIVEQNFIETPPVLGVPEMMAMPETAAMPEPVTIPEPAPMAAPVTPEFNMPPMPAVAPAEAPLSPAMEAPSCAPENAPAFGNEPLGMQKIRESALRDLAPILDKMNVNPAQKFRIYRDMFEDLRDYTVLEPAYRAAKGIADERERGEALLYLIEAIDRM